MTDQSHNEYDRSIVNQPEIEYRNTKFCRRCGQKIKWEEEDGKID